MDCVLWWGYNMTSATDITQYTKVGQIPLTNEPNQEFQIVLNGQNCVIGVFQKDNSVFVNLWLDNEPIFLGVSALDRVGLKLSDYMAFKGQLWFEDKNGTQKPDYTEFGTRYFFYYGTR